MGYSYRFGSEGDNKIFVEIFTAITGEKTLCYIEKESGDEVPVQYFTATTDMKDWIGTVREITENNGEKLLSVEGVYRGTKQLIKGIKCRDSNIKKVGDRVMVTEHLNVAGSFDMIATKSRIIDLQKPDLNFVNIGWTNKDHCRYLRVDPYTGETKECVGNSIL